MFPSYSKHTMATTPPAVPAMTKSPNDVVVCCSAVTSPQASIVASEDACFPSAASSSEEYSTGRVDAADDDDAGRPNCGFALGGASFDHDLSRFRRRWILLYASSA